MVPKSSTQIVKKNKMSVRGNVAYIFDGLVLFRLENKGGNFIQIEKAIALPDEPSIERANEVTIIKELVDTLFFWDDPDISYIPTQTFMKIENKFFKFCNK